MVKTSGVGSYNTLSRHELKTEEFIYTVHNVNCALSKSLTDLNGFNGEHTGIESSKESRCAPK